MAPFFSEVRIEQLLVVLAAVQTNWLKVDVESLKFNMVRIAIERSWVK